MCNSLKKNKQKAGNEHRNGKYASLNVACDPLSRTLQLKQPISF